MRPHRVRRVSTRRRRVLLSTALGSAALLLSGCSEEVQRGWLPQGAVEGADIVTGFWVWTWVAAIVVGLLVAGLLAWSLIRYRRKPEDAELPPQIKYNVPLEVVYTVIPLLMVGVIWYFTAKYESELLSLDKKPDVTVSVVGKQWSWDFNYVDDNVHYSGVQAVLTGQDGVEKTLPTLVLPEGKRIEFVLTARDVIHSFWVPAFQMKMDMIPGRVNKFQVNNAKPGTYQGKCAELCGAYHSAMLFNVKVVPAAEYQQYITSLKSNPANQGLVGSEYNRNISPLEPNQRTLEPKAGSK